MAWWDDDGVAVLKPLDTNNDAGFALGILDDAPVVVFPVVYAAAAHDREDDVEQRGIVVVFVAVELASVM